MPDTGLIQPLVFGHREDRSVKKRLYYSGRDVSVNDNAVRFETNGWLDLFSYFNLFNLAKWSRYTRAGPYQLRLNLSGRFRVRLHGHRGVRTAGRPWRDQTISGDGWVTFPLPVKGAAKCYSVSLAAPDGGLLRGGGWYAETPSSPQPPVRIALIICTYKREDFLLNNLRLLDACLPAGWNVFVVDNGRTFVKKKTGQFDERFHFFDNPNTGGCGGFTRGLIEVLGHGRQWTHAVLMDDDVVLQPAALERTAALVRYLKPEYRGHFIGGAMLRLDSPCLQHESGAYWNGVRVKPLRHNLDLSRPRVALANEGPVYRKNRYAAWWYCVIPLDASMSDDLPAPLFLNGDDIEYSLRRARGIIHLNGIAVWHQPIAAKHHPVKRHYLAVRNGLIINARHGFPLAASLALVAARLLKHILLLRAGDARLVLRGLDDFLKGPDHLRGVDTPALLTGAGAERAGERLSWPALFRLARQLVLRYSSLTRAYGRARWSARDWREINRGDAGGSPPA